MSGADTTGGLRRPKGVKADINVTPLVDVVLVLLIIFMVVTPQLEAGATVELPKANNPDEKSEALEPTTLSLTAAGDVYFDKQQLSLESLEARLRKLKQEKPHQKLVLKADRNAPYGKVRSLFRTCQQLDFPGVSLQVTQAPKT